MSQRKKDRRVNYIDDLRDHIARNVPLDYKLARSIVDKWCDGGKANTPAEHGVFAACEQIRDDIERMP